MHDCIDSYPSWTLKINPVRVTITRMAGMMAPVEFFIDTAPLFSPYFVNPWNAESLPVTDPVLGPLRGNFFCLPFGTADEDHSDQNTHGDPVAREWVLTDHSVTDDHVRASFACRTDNPPGRITKEISLIRGHNVVYSRHRLQGYSVTVPLGFHATLAPTQLGEELSVTVGQYNFGIVSERLKKYAGGEYNCLKAGATFRDLEAVPTVWQHPSTIDCTTYPHVEGFTDIVLLTWLRDSSNGAPVLSSPAWNAVVFPKAGALWFSLKNPAILPSTMIWMEAGGRHQGPWLGRTHCIGVEDVCAYGGLGRTLSVGENEFSQVGVPTAVQLLPNAPLEIPYIEGAVQVPPGFDRVQSIQFEDQGICFFSTSGVQAYAEVFWKDYFPRPAP